MSPSTSEDKEDDQNNNKKTPNIPTSTLNLNQQYTLAVQSDSYNEIWSITHKSQIHGEIQEILRPNKSSINEAIRLSRPNRLNRLISRYLLSSEQTSNLFLSIRKSVDLAHEIYAPISLLLEILPESCSILSQAQSDRVFDDFVDFDSRLNPFRFSEDGFDEIRDCFSVLKKQLELRVLRAERHHRLLRQVAIAAIVPIALCCGSDLLEGRRRDLREKMREMDAAAREIYVLDKNLSTIERLVARLQANVESDKVLVRMGIERGRGQIHPVQEILCQLRKNHLSLCYQLTDLDEHVCLCLAGLNRARFLLVQQIQRLRSIG